MTARAPYVYPASMFFGCSSLRCSLRSPPGWSCGLLGGALMLLGGVLINSAGGESAESISRSGESTRGELEFRTDAVWVRNAEGRSVSLGVEQLKRLTVEKILTKPPRLEMGETSGLEVSYYTNATFRGVPMRASVAGFVHEAAVRARAQALSPGPISSRWAGQIAVPMDGVFRFSVTSDRPVRLWIQGQCVASIRSNGVSRISSAETILSGGRPVSVVLEESDGLLERPPQPKWSAPGLSLQAVPSSLLRTRKDRDPILEITRGLLVTYFGNPQFGNPRVIRVDSDLATNWTAQPPFLDLGMSWRFSATWEGKVSVPRKGSYRISADSDGGVQISLNGQTALRRWNDRPGGPAGHAAFPVSLEARDSYPIKVEFFNELPPAALHIYWYPSQGLESPPFADGLIPAEPPDFSLAVPASEKGVGPGLDRAGVVLCDGSMTVQSVLSATRSQLSLASGEIASKVALDLVSRIQLAASPDAVGALVGPFRSGVLLHDGDFLEGELISMDADEVRLNSILFGAHRLRRERAAVIFLRPLRASLPRWEILTTSGSSYRSTEIAFGPRSVSLKGFMAGDFTVGQDKVVSIESFAP